MSERNTRDQSAKPPSQGDPESTRTTSFIGVIGRIVARFDHALSDRLPLLIARAGERAADSTRKTIHSGRWQNYAFVAVLALVAVTTVVLFVRGCAAPGASP